MSNSRNILDKTDKSLAPVPNRNGEEPKSTPKREKWDWSTGGGEGEFARIHKTQLNIDGRYQRDAVSQKKVLEIARNWDWLMFGALAVIKRVDGSLWVFDGGHRTRASFYRDDISLLPCMVHSLNDVSDEAKGFVARNTMVSSVSAVDRYNASLCAKEPIAVATDAMLTEIGLEVAGGGTNSPNVLLCIGTIIHSMEQDQSLTRRCLEFAIKLSSGEQISGHVIRGLFALCRHFTDVDILDVYGDSLAKHSLTEMEIRMRQKKAELGKGGEKTEALALMDMINKGRRNRLTW